jgi:hypothetical protein
MKTDPENTAFTNEGKSAGCLACKEQRTHTEREWENHPFHRQGFDQQQGYSHPSLDPASPDYQPPADRKEPAR